MDRSFLFGKYKGRSYKEIILTHIGYVMWCLENIDSFSLNEEEQEVYDAIAISIKRYNCKMVFPVETMYKHVKDQNKLKNLDTPVTLVYGSYFRIDSKSSLYPLVKKYLHGASSLTTDMLNAMANHLSFPSSDDNCCLDCINCADDM